ncbi:hypothetical protein A1O7_04376 [Cladophialophora yegresii CBS 114405]|uniref:SPIN90/Ldb17 leucine-rich domain-containing protein n=1 Tax=Cladophialophora yegresii CBS 114405 TaxID=1182544 RepID=W9WP85_9EURO|nr:uncharacterized protein A1O7_04376 [Cladophialophora yegresii CBS 114405]EXJ60224.1 hypothetical protein A1O7_04376 [Cladophialophora yegresii CBS 114405]
MEHEVTSDFEGEQQFWIVLEETVSKQCDTHDSIDDTLRSYIDLIGSCRERFLPSDYDLARCALKLQESPLFAAHADYVCRQFVHCLIEDDEPNVVLVATSFLIAHARSNEATYQLMNQEGAFLRLIDLIESPKQHGHEGIHRLLMELLYDMSRIQRIKTDDLARVHDDFVKMLFEIIEQVSDDVDDPYHYPTIRVLLVLNEQFMVAAHDPVSGHAPAPLTNKVIKVLSAHGSAYKTFGENIILLLNREDETSLQLLTLKLLYLLFTTPPTYEYFYTNDLRVLVDILIRNLLDLPEEASSLRHTYLRVLYPLLEHTQLQHPPHYKRDEIRKLLVVLGGGHLTDQNGSQEGLHHWGHFDAVDETTKRLVKRCEGVSWLTDPETKSPMQAESPTEDVASDLSSPTSPSKAVPPALPAPRKLKKRNSTKNSVLTIGQYLTPQLEGARQSSLSMMAVAAQTEKPGVITPSRNPSLKNNLRAAIMQKKEKPPPPQARRSGAMRTKAQRMESDAEIATAELPEHEQAATKPGDAPATPKPDNGPPTAKPEKEPATPRPEADDNHQNQSRYNHHSSIPFHHRHVHGKALVDIADKEKLKEKDKPPPIPTHHRGLPFSKKPPPTPKARRRKGRDGSGDSTREPGRFSANLPSIITTTISGKRIPEHSPFSPVGPTLSPSDPDSASTLESRAKLPVSEALEKAQARALDQIHETMDHLELEEKSPAGPGAGNKPTLPPLEEDVIEDAGHENIANPPVYTEMPAVSRVHSQEELDQPFHDAVTNQVLSSTTPYSAQSRTLSSSTPPESITPNISQSVPTIVDMPSVENKTTQHPQPEMQMPRMVLTPPAQEPSRGVPGPQFEMERSPFLTDEEVEEEETDQTDDDELDKPGAPSVV